VRQARRIASSLPSIRESVHLSLAFPRLLFSPFAESHLQISLTRSRHLGDLRSACLRSTTTPGNVFRYSSPPSASIPPTMPIFRGLELSVVASTEGKNLPEYPHPDGSSVRLLSPDDARITDSHSSPRPSDSSILSDGDPTRQKKFNPRISVYIPSVPGMPRCRWRMLVLCHIANSF
jgi:hypothetical protein